MRAKTITWSKLIWFHRDIQTVNKRSPVTQTESSIQLELNEAIASPIHCSAGDNKIVDDNNSWRSCQPHCLTMRRLGEKGRGVEIECVEALIGALHDSTCIFRPAWLSIFGGGVEPNHT